MRAIFSASSPIRSRSVTIFDTPMIKRKSLAAGCRARKRLPEQMVRGLAKYTGEAIAAHAPTSWRWRGRRVRLVDGTTVSMPDTFANQRAYPQSRSQRSGLGFPLCRMVGIVCLVSGAVLNAATGRYRGKGGDERTLLRSMLDTLERGDVLVGDALFATYFLLCALRERGIDAVFEQHGARQRTTDFRRGKRLGVRDHLIELDKPAIKPDWMSKAPGQRPRCKRCAQTRPFMTWC